MLRMLAGSAAAVSAAVALAAPVLPAAADPQTIPNGPWVQDSQHVSLERLHSHEELGRALARIEQRSQGDVSVDVVGQSNEGRELYLAKAGTGDKTLLYVAQQHGDEPLGAEAALELLQRVAAGGSEVEAWLEEVTLLVVPRVNPDGAARFQRYNHDPDCDGDVYDGQYCREGAGFDINRYHSPDIPLDTNPVPEAVAVQRVFAAHQPDIVVDFHHQGTYASDDGDMITTSVFWPIAEGVESSVVDVSKQTALTIYDTLEHYGFAEVSQYPGSTFEGIFRNAYGLRGAGSVLVELRGGIGQKSSGKLIRTAYASMFAVLESYAEGSLTQNDPSRAEEDIPLRGDRVSNPH